MELTFKDETKGTYKPLQFHIHAPSEHALNGELFDLEMHIVHQAADGELAVLGFFFTADNDTESPFLADLLAKIPSANGVALDDLDLKDLLDDNIAGHFFSYDGSLTTPPCTEGVKWTVVENAIDMSVAQKKVFDDYYKENPSFAGGKGNNRALQALNARVLIEGWEGEGDGHHDHSGATYLGAAGAALVALAALSW